MRKYKIVYEGKTGTIGCSANRDSMIVYTTSPVAAWNYATQFLSSISIVRIEEEIISNGRPEWVAV